MFIAWIKTISPPCTLRILSFNSILAARKELKTHLISIKSDRGIYKKTVPNEQYHQKFKQSCNKDKVGDLILLSSKTTTICLVFI